ncbi:MAG: succinate dehydrogenase, hydrophobic membrane anchor protein [Methylococcus sp.]
MKSKHEPRRNTAREATGEWLRERLSSILMIPLTLWVVLSYAWQLPRNHEQFVAWMMEPAHYAPLMIFLLLSSYHALLGMKVIIDDYVHHTLLHGLGLAACRLLLYGSLIIAATSLFLLVSPS